MYMYNVVELNLFPFRLPFPQARAVNAARAFNGSLLHSNTYMYPK